MKTVNADYGIDTLVDCMGTDRKKPKWYHWHRFPLLPIWSYRPADDYNESMFSFSWLNLRVWSMISPDIGFEFNIEDIGAYLSVRVLYVKIVLWLMLFPEAWHQKLWRVPRR